ncbi:hypothetical protein BG261_03815 [Floricoccus tropicus]|uniref:Uncharacterized protein n=1 Tax=Floricoccus tropicus TaxID=1859473 RepID=A0A1E8GMG4_9LACT|nr:hypothetical protein [Floricoccus tropicus]OFI49206.1 hypothetical protein BG261_03815 [Floricoccus tropicus]
MLNKNENTIKSQDSLSEFQGIIAEKVLPNEDVSNTYRVFLNNIEAISDDENLLPILNNFGLVLNLIKEQFQGIRPNKLKIGDKVIFSLKGIPPMTMSIPPQVAGVAVDYIKLVEE